MNTGAFGEGFPYTNFHNLNMDWIVKIAKDFLDQYTNIQQTIDNGLTDLDNKAESLENLLQEWYDTHSEDIANQLRDALSDLDQELTENIASFDSHAEQKARETIASIPDDYTALSNTVVDFIKTTNNVFNNAMKKLKVSGTTEQPLGKTISFSVKAGDVVTIEIEKI